MFNVSILQRRYLFILFHVYVIMYTPSELTIQFKILKNTFPTFYYYSGNIMT